MSRLVWVVTGNLKFGDEFAGLTAAKNDPILANAQAPKPGEWVAQWAHITLFPNVNVIECPANIPAHSRVKLLERSDYLVGELHAGTGERVLWPLMLLLVDRRSVKFLAGTDRRVGCLCPPVRAERRSGFIGNHDRDWTDSSLDSQMSSATSDSSFLAANRNFLIVDSDADGRVLFVRTLMRVFPQAAVIEVQDFERALSLLKSHSYDAIIAHSAVGVDPITLVRELRAADAEVPILAASKTDRREEFKAAGATKFMVSDEWLLVGSNVADLLSLSVRSSGKS